MKTSIFSRIFLAIVIVAFISTAVAIIFTVRDQTTIFRSSLSREKIELFEFLSSDLENKSPEEVSINRLETISNSPDTEFFWLIKPDGKVFYADDSSVVGSISQDPFVGLEEPNTRRAIYNDREVEVIGYPVELEGYQEPWVFLAGVSLVEYTAFLAPALVRGLLILAGATLIAVYLALVFTDKIIKPLMELRKVIKEIGRGNLDQKINIKTGDEVEVIGEEFNNMTERLKAAREELEETKKILEIRVNARTRELEELTDTLEEKVEARTEQLRRKVEELEKFHKLTVGREKKMIELKEKNKELKEKNEKLREKLDKLKENKDEQE